MCEKQCAQSAPQPKNALRVLKRKCLEHTVQAEEQTAKAIQKLRRINRLNTFSKTQVLQHVLTVCRIFLFGHTISHSGDHSTSVHYCKDMETTKNNSK